MKEALESLIAEMVEKGIRFEEARTEFERRFIQRVMRRNGENRSLAAQELGIHRNTLSRKLEEMAAQPLLHSVAKRHSQERQLRGQRLSR